MSNKQIIKILVDESIIKQIAEDVKFVNNQQFIKYAKEKFLSEENYSNLNLEKFIIHVCDQIGSKTGESDVFPFAGANTPEEVRNVFISLPSVLQGSLMKNLYAIRAVRNIFNDINDFNNLSSEQKNTLNQLGSLNDTIKEKIDEQKKETKLAKQNSKSMRRLHTLTKDRTLVND